MSVLSPTANHLRQRLLPALVLCLAGSLAGCGPSEPIAPGADSPPKTKSADEPPTETTAESSPSAGKAPIEAVATADVKSATAKDAASSDTPSSRAAANDKTNETDNAAQPIPAPRDGVLLVTPRGPLVVRLEIMLDDQPQRAVAEQVLLSASRLGGRERRSWSEYLELPAISSGRLGNRAVGNVNEQRQVVQQYDVNRDNRAQLDELANFLAQEFAAGRPFAVNTNLDARDYAKSESTLFSLLDADQDGQLSAAEITTAPERLRSRDADDDDSVTLADFRRPAVGDMMSRDTTTRPPQRAFELHKRELDSIYYTLCDVYDAGNGLDGGCFALNPSLLARLDANKNGAVDQSELAAILDAPADLTFRVRLGQTNRSQPVIELIETGEDLAAAGIKTAATPGSVQITLGELNVRLAVNDLPPLSVANQAAIVKQFKALDTDNSGLIDAPELAAVPASGGFELENWDLNGDGKLSLDEVKSGIAGPRSYPTVQVQVRTGQGDDPLFGWLNVRQDGRLSLREMQGASARLALLDKNGDGLITAAELPEGMTCSIIRGGRNQNAMPVVQAMARTPAGKNVPRWLSAMDTNGDGEVSPREFLGTPQQFTALDTNGDGFVDASEAATISDPAKADETESEKSPDETEPDAAAPESDKPDDDNPPQVDPAE